MRSETASSSSYKQFRGWVAQQRIVLDKWTTKPWKYYDYGPKEEGVIPLILIPGVSGTAEVYFKQMISLCPKGFRLISVQPPDFMNYTSWCKGFDLFLQKFEFKKIHLFGSALGGFMCQIYAQYRPSVIQSLILCNSFCDVTYYANNAPCAGMFPFMPEFMLKRLVLSNFPTTQMEEDVRESVDFMVEQLETLSGAELASRLTLNCTVVDVQPEKMTFDKKRVLLIESLDDVAVPQKMRDDLLKYFPEAKLAEIKSGGNFTYLSRADEVNLHIQVHIRKWNEEMEEEETNEEDQHREVALEVPPAPSSPIETESYMKKNEKLFQSEEGQELTDKKKDPATKPTRKEGKEEVEEEYTTL